MLIGIKPPSPVSPGTPTCLAIVIASLVPRKNKSPTIKMEKVMFTETLVPIYQCTRGHAKDVSNHYTDSREGEKFQYIYL